MWNYVKTGFHAAKGHAGIWLLLFLYQFAWGFFLFRWINSTVTPLLKRYPGDTLSSSDVMLFWAEAEFWLTRTKEVMPYVWMLGAVLLARMVLTPLLNAGLYYAVHQRGMTGKRSRRPFLRGIRTLGRAFTIVYWLKTVAALLPLLYIVPWLHQLTLSAGSWSLYMGKGLPAIACYLLYLAVLQLIAMYVQFGIAADRPALFSLGLLAKGLLPASCIGLAILAIAAAAALFSASVSLFWAGLVAVILHQIYTVIRPFFGIWHVTAQHLHWKEKASL
ncbi:hypothetical protein DUZ99_08495 [Xylanibacillus composti]|uniref:Uncharacterized protein n=1 Tax=Xylanibacillus composti TaxID=1572762 RepID=A0A8J4GYE2_9BACL|nr:hypothetical protein [Xylanibacillus composti]MDT9725033.1 hypothetical protein [Xylanibacillus composti]GIQ67487.1 hypothetical protein XYCOK13_03110 [Xylanibacillus composti]